MDEECRPRWGDPMFRHFRTERGRLVMLPWKIAITFDELMRKLIGVFHDREDVEHMRARMTA